jgi:hypothetical protein
MDGPARRLACHMLGEFFSQPLLDGRPPLRLVVDNDLTKTPI